MAKPTELFLFLFSLVGAIIMWLLPKTLPIVIISLIAIFLLLVYPVWNFWWIEKSLWLRLSALLFVASCLCMLGYIVLPKEQLIEQTGKTAFIDNEKQSSAKQPTAEDIATEVAKRIPKLIPESNKSKQPQQTLSKDTRRILTNSELQDKVIKFANNLRDFEQNFKSQELQRVSLLPPLAGTKEQNEQMWRERNARELERYMEYEVEFRRKYLAEAMDYYIELYKRLNIAPPKDDFPHIAALTGRLAGPMPLNDLATWLERLARQLPP